MTIDLGQYFTSHFAEWNFRLHLSWPVFLQPHLAPPLGLQQEVENVIIISVRQCKSWHSVCIMQKWENMMAWLGSTRIGLPSLCRLSRLCVAVDEPRCNRHTLSYFLCLQRTTSDVWRVSVLCAHWSQGDKTDPTKDNAPAKSACMKCWLIEMEMMKKMEEIRAFFAFI